ncbi:ABC transporter permease subunit [Streptomyces sp. RFCAC02]|uniref:ABC transporter permease subunit n=1 Tax=Streptomyces sp. RFCAC02 TaxID=2499143 RepID=UPI0010214D47|nr:ABC transporter permease subunit [Streptomyces sp. RFCAC02]
MIWLSWRQFRAQALVAALALALATAYLVHLGLDIRDAHDVYEAHCGEEGGDCAQAASHFRSSYENTLLYLAAGMALLPAVIGTFWGAPLIARELETGTHRLVWNQSVTRRRWLLVKLLVVCLAAIAVTGAVSALLTWAAGPYDEVAQDRFRAIVFLARGFVPVGHAVLAVVLGTVLGLLLRRAIPAMGITLAAVLVIEFLVPNYVRPHLMTPETTTLAMTAEAINEAKNLGSVTGGATIGGLQVPDAPGAWISHTSSLRTADGASLSESTFNDCLNNAPETGADGRFGDTAVCLGDLGLHVDISYHPADRYWPFQGLETAMYFGAGALLTGFALWRIQRRVS